MEAVAHHVKVVSVKLRDRPAGLGCDRLRGIGFRAVCDCGEQSRIVATHRAARALARDLVKMSQDHGTSCEAT